MKRLNRHQPVLARKAFGLIAVLTALNTAACSRHTDDSSGPANENLALTNPGASTLTAKFHFPSDHRQALAAPNGHALQGATFVTEPDSFSRDITIAMKEGVPVATNRIAKELALPAAMTAAGPAVLIASQDQIADATRAAEITLPVKIDRTEVNQNLTVIYRVIQQGQGGKTVTGLMPMNQLEPGEHSIRFRSNFLGVFQPVYYNGDPGAVREIRSTDGFFGLDDPQAKAPEAFIVRTPTGQVIGTYPKASWSTSLNAVSYEVSITRNQNCTDVVREYSDVPSTIKTIDGLNEGNYFLCVTAVSAGGTRTAAANNGLPFQLTFSHIGLFRYDAPRVFATNNPQIRWTAAQNATQYRAAISSSPGCAQPLEEIVTSQLSWTPSTRRGDGTYYVCVTALDDNGHKQMIDVDSGRPYGEGLSVIIDTTMPGAFSVLGLGGPRGVVTWSQSSEAVMYHLTISSDSSCSQTIRSYRNIVGTQTSVQVAGLQENESYNVCLSSVDNAGNVRVASNNGTRMTFDTTPPRVLNVESTNKPGSYGLGAQITIVVNFSEPVVFSGSSSDVRLLLNTRTSANYISGSGTSRWLFAYKVESNTNLLLDYSSTNSLTFGSTGGRDNAGNNAILTLPETGSENSLATRGRIVLDTIAPSLVSSIPANGARDVAVRPELSFVFSEAPVSTNSLVVVTKSSDQSDITSSFDISFDAANLTLKATLKSGATSLASGSAYKAQLRGLRDAAGNEMAVTSIQFTTK